MTAVVEEASGVDLVPRTRDDFTTVFSTTVTACGGYVLAGDRAGRVIVWNVVDCFRTGYWTNAAGQSPTPAAIVHAHMGSIYSLVFVSKDVFVTASDEEMRGWSWSQVLAVVNGGPEPTPIFELCNPQLSVGRGGLAPVCETNGLAVNAQGSALFAASGDGRAYMWDLPTQKVVGTMIGHEKYLHAIACRKNGQVVTGSEDGTVKLWDSRQSGCTATLTPSTEQRPWIGAVAVDDDDNLLAAGGGGRTAYLWHLGSNALLANMPCPGPVQAVAFANDRVITAGAYPYIHQWRANGRLAATCPTKATSLFALTVAARSFGSVGQREVVITGGDSTLLDIFVDTNQSAFTLSTISKTVA